MCTCLLLQDQQNNWGMTEFDSRVTSYAIKTKPLCEVIH